MKSSNQHVSDDNEGSERGESQTTFRKKGGWITFPFIMGTVMGLSVAAGGWYANITVYAIQKYNIDPITATKIHNVSTGGIYFFPIVAAIIADSFCGPYLVVLFGTFVSLLGGVMFTLSAALTQLRPPSCNNSSTQVCQKPSSNQYTFLYITLALAMMGLGGTRFLLGTIGADQYDKTEHRKIYFNWFLFAFEFGLIIAFTATVYIQVNVSWAIGYGINVVASAVAVVIFVSGTRFYRRFKPQGSPFTSIARVIVASIRKAKLSRENYEYFYEITTSKVPTSSLRFFNRAAMIDKSVTYEPKKSWSLCTVEEVEDLKTLMTTLTIFGAGLLESTIYAVSSGLVTVQALVMDRRIGPHFQIPAGTVFVFTTIWAAFFVVVLDRILYPLWEKITGWPLSLLQRIGIGYFFNMAGMVAYALVERKRLDLVHSLHLFDQHNAVAPMSACWLFVPLGLLGTGTALYLSTELAFYYQEFPKSLRTTSTSITSLRLAVGYYLSIAIIAVVQKKTNWLPGDINHGSADKLYWLISAMGLVNFVIYLATARVYKYKNTRESDAQTFASEHSHDLTK